MKAIILAAGTGSRLRPFTMNRPKAKVEVCGSTLIDRLVMGLRGVSSAEIVVVGGHHADQLEGVGDRLIRNANYLTTNMVWSLRSALHELDGPCLIAYGDCAYEPTILRDSIRAEGDFVVPIDSNWKAYWSARFAKPETDAESLRINPDGSIAEIGQSVTDLENIDGQFMGLLKVGEDGARMLRQWLHGLPETMLGTIDQWHSAFLTDLIQSMIRQGQKVIGQPMDGTWVEIDSPNDLRSEVTESRIRYIDSQMSKTANKLV